MRGVDRRRSTRGVRELGAPATGRRDRQGRAAELIEETIQDARAAGSTKLVWHTGDRVSPPFMDASLARRGFETTERLEVMAFELGSAPEPALPRLTVPTGVRAELAGDAAGLRGALLVDSEVFSSPPPSGEEFAGYAGQLEELARRARCGGPPAGGASLALRFVAYVDSVSEDRGEVEKRPVAAAGAEVVGETVRLWGAGTLEGYRGRGAYRALVLERCRLAHALGATLALTKANASTSVPILERAGFRPVAHERRHTLELGKSAVSQETQCLKPPKPTGSRTRASSPPAWPGAGGSPTLPA